MGGKVTISKHHSTVSRRDFLKILGLGGVGLGAAVSAMNLNKSVNFGTDISNGIPVPS